MKIASAYSFDHVRISPQKQIPDGRILPVVVDEPYVVAGPFEVVFQSESLEYAAIVGMQGEGQ